jgi:MFS family permease
LKHITKAVWILSLVSLFTDTASEMLYPIMPIYLQSIGFSIVLIGILEGIAEAVAGLSKGYFGKLSDSTGKRVPFVRIGYAFSAISKPMMAFFVYPLWIFFARTIDRFGKGIRTGARDALLSDEATAATKGMVFGFHRSLDTLGAVLGPIIALVYLYYHPDDYITLFYFAFIPGLLAIIASFFLKEREKVLPIAKEKPSLLSFFGYWKESPYQYKKVVLGLLAFTLINSSDVFLILKVKEAGLDDTMVIGIYIFYNLIYALAALPLGIIADKFGFKKMYIFGLFIFTLVYIGMAGTSNIYVIIAMFFLYGIYAAATEGVSKAWISNITAKDEMATAIGTFTGFQSICSMLASTLAGIIWYNFGATAMFIVTGLAVVPIILYLGRMHDDLK